MLVHEKSRKIVSKSQQLEEKTKQLKQVEDERERVIADLNEALGNIKTLQGIIPVCSNCKKIYDDHGYW